MLKRLLVLLLIALPSCDGAGDEPQPDRAPATFAAVYFWSEKGLVPEFHDLRGTDNERALFSLLAEGPVDGSLETRLPRGSELIQAGEAGEGHLLIEPSADFWTGSSRTVYERVAQVVQTMGVLEEGRRITLLRGIAPARIRRPGGKQLDQPIERDDLPPPLVRVGQPTPGGAVGTTIPLLIDVAGARPVGVTVERDGETLARASLRSGQGQIEVPEDVPSGPLKVVIALGDGISVTVPVRLSS